MTPAVRVENLRVELVGTGDDVVSGISFEIAQGEILGLVGESGSGKTTVGTALLGYARRGATIAGGSVLIDGSDILALNDDEVRRLRGPLVSYVPQDPSSALNPGLRVGKQLMEVLSAHGRTEGAHERVAEALREVNLPGTNDLLSRYPHQLSGGQQQRICIAMAFLLRPRLVVLDEPTTGLDVTTQAHVLATVRELAKTHGAAALYVTHDLAVVANLADRVLVMYAGRLAELGSGSAIFDSSAHPYTAQLLRAIPDVGERRLLAPLAGDAPSPGNRPGGCEFAPRCFAAIAKCHTEDPPLATLQEGHVARCHRAAEYLLPARPAPPPRVAIPSSDTVLSVSRVNASYGGRQVLHDVSLDLRPGECLALVGESGSGKTTLARCIIGLHSEWTGNIALHGRELERRAIDRPVGARQELQYVFQSPYSSLNPRKTVRQIVETPLKHFHGISGAAADAPVRDAIAQVALTKRILQCYPNQLSGGERQRVAIARALAGDPGVLICDEVTSALDVSVQASVVEVLRQLQVNRGLTMLFVTHDLALVRSISDRVLVMRHGRLVEFGETDTVLETPTTDYTRQLLADTPSITAGRTLELPTPK